jgi:hypothetical protein
VKIDSKIWEGTINALKISCGAENCRRKEKRKAREKARGILNYPSRQV